MRSEYIPPLAKYRCEEPTWKHTCPRVPRIRSAWTWSWTSGTEPSKDKSDPGHPGWEPVEKDMWVAKGGMPSGTKYWVWL